MTTFGLEKLPSAARTGSLLLLAHEAREARPNGEAGPEGASAWRESKKRTKEKGLPRRSKPVIGSVAGIFRLAIHGSVEKTMHILCIALRVCVDFGRSKLLICLIAFRKKWGDLRSPTRRLRCILTTQVSMSCACPCGSDASRDALIFSDVTEQLRDLRRSHKIT